MCHVLVPAHGTGDVGPIHTHQWFRIVKTLAEEIQVGAARIGVKNFAKVRAAWVMPAWIICGRNSLFGHAFETSSFDFGALHSQLLPSGHTVALRFYL
jgi:hypothetical protein